MRKNKEKQRKVWKTAALDVLYLVSCSLHCTVPDKKRVAGMDFKKVYALSRSQSLEAMTYISLERLIRKDPEVQKDIPEPILKKWEEARNKTIRKTLLMDAERERLFAYMEQKKIWHLPLKGIILHRLYPEFGMRQMADHDILFDASFRQEVKDWFVSHGYKIKSFEESNHDEYHKEPVYNFEMHTDLFHKDSYPQFFEYYVSLKNRLKPVKGKAFEYSMTEEDFYLYLLAHAYKHYCNCGTGVRLLVDLYVYCKAKDSMDVSYLEKELVKTGLYDFEKEMRELSLKIFAPDFRKDSLTEKEWSVLKELMFFGTYGSLEKYWENKIKKIQPDGQKISVFIKVKYVMRRIFPGKEHMEKWAELYAPFFFKNKWLMPAAYIWRMVRLKKEHKEMVKKEFDTVRKI